jgi:hypothetical protein
LRDLEPADRKIVGDDIRDCEFAWPVGLPLCRPIAGRRGLWEIRSNLTRGRIARVLFCIERGHVVLLHGFIPLMTGHRGQAEARASRAAGIREVLKKPLLSADLAKGLARHLVLHRRDYGR